MPVTLMSLTTYATPLAIELRRSNVLAAYLLAVHGVSFVVPFLPMELPFWLRGLMVLGVFVSAVYCARFYVFQWADDAIVRAVWNEQDWMLEFASGEQRSACLRPGTYVSPALVVLGFRVSGRRWPHYLVLAPDSCDVGSLRRLRVRLALEHGGVPQRL